MPKDTKVHRMYDGMRKKGMPEDKAARIAQGRSGQSLATGKPPKRKLAGMRKKRDA